MYRMLSGYSPQAFGSCGREGKGSDELDNFLPVKTVETIASPSMYLYAAFTCLLEGCSRNVIHF